MIHRTCLAIVACGVAGSLPALCAEVINQRLDADAHGTVEITDAEGAINVSGWDRPQVEVTGELGADAERVDVERSGSTLTIKVAKRMSGSVFSGGTRLEVKLPAASSLRASSVSAAVSVRGLIGAQHLQTVNGNIDTEAAAADLDLKSVDGNIQVRGSGQNLRLTLSTVNGKIDLHNVNGDIDADTVSGDLAADKATLRHARIKTISGNVTLGGRLAADARIEVSSINGSLHLHWANAQDANIQVEYFGGDIHTCFAGNPVEKAQYGPGSSWRNVKQGASSEVHAKSLSGSTEICDK